MTTNETKFTARIGISGTLEYRDAQGNILKTVQVTGSIPLENLMPEAGEAAKDEDHGDHVYE